MNKIPTIAFFGTPQIAVWVLDELKKENLLPALVITNPDAPKGRKLALTPSPVALWAEREGIETLKLQTLKDASVAEALKSSGCDLFIVAAYGKIIPQAILDIPKYKTLNVHPSLLPKLRGASPIRSAILQDVFPTGVSIMVLTQGIDEGPLLAQEAAAITPEMWPVRGAALDYLLAQHGGSLLARTIPKWVEGSVNAQAQKHSEATYCEKITKEMGELDLTADPYKNYLKICAFDEWPGTYFFTEQNGKRVRVKIAGASFAHGTLTITRVIPEGKKEMDYTAFLKE